MNFLQGGMGLLGLLGFLVQTMILENSNVLSWKSQKSQKSHLETKVLSTGRREMKESAANYIRLKKKKEGCPYYPDVMDEEDERWFNPPNDAWLI